MRAEEEPLLHGRTGRSTIFAAPPSELAQLVERSHRPRFLVAIRQVVHSRSSLLALLADRRKNRRFEANELHGRRQVDTEFEPQFHHGLSCYKTAAAYATLSSIHAPLCIVIELRRRVPLDLSTASQHDAVLSHGCTYIYVSNLCIMWLSVRIIAGKDFFLAVFFLSSHENETRALHVHACNRFLQLVKEIPAGGFGRYRKFSQRNWHVCSYITVVAITSHGGEPLPWNVV